MFEDLPLAEYQRRPLGELVDAYLALDQQDSGYLADMSEQMQANAPPSYMEAVGRSELVVPISIDAAREPLPGVLRTLDQFAQQVDQGAPPFFVVAHLNRVYGRDNAHAQLLADALRSVAHELPFPLGFFETGYLHQIPIGGIKKDTLDVAITTLAAAYQGRELPERFAIFTQDADLVRLARKALGKMSGALAAGASVVVGSVRHARSIGKFAEQPDMPHLPQMDRVLWEFDAVHNLAASQFRWEVQTLSLLRDYLLAEGIDAEDEWYEMNNVISHAAHSLDNFKTVHLKHQFAVMSARRPYAGLHRGVSPIHMWSQNFSAEGDYRNMDVHALQDLHPAMAEAMILELTSTRINRFGESVNITGRLYDQKLDEARSAFLTDHPAPLTYHQEGGLVFTALRRRQRMLKIKQLVLAQAMAQTGGY